MSRGSQHPAAVAGGWEHSVIMSLLASRDGSVWISAIDRGVARLRNGELRRFTAGLPEEFVLPCTEDSDGTIFG